MTAVESGLDQRLTAASLSSLETRIDQLTSRLDKPNQTTPVSVRARVIHPTKPTQAASLPFTVMGTELRGGERFLSILPTGTTAFRSEEHTSELQSLMRISYAVFCL